MIVRILGAIHLATVTDAEIQAAVGGNRDARAEMLAGSGQPVHHEDPLDVFKAAVIF
ncbi:hypothetical protein D9M68_979370 [compost metagenome]